MVSTRTGMVDSPCVRIRCIAIVTGPSIRPAANFICYAAACTLWLWGRGASDADTVLRAGPRADFAGPVQSLGRAGLAAAGAAPRRHAFRILRAARRPILPGERPRAGPGIKHIST